jgi:hypothetical protein
MLGHLSKTSSSSSSAASIIMSLPAFAALGGRKKEREKNNGHTALFSHQAILRFRSLIRHEKVRLTWVVGPLTMEQQPCQAPRTSRLLDRHSRAKLPSKSQADTVATLSVCSAYLVGSTDPPSTATRQGDCGRETASKREEAHGDMTC